MVSTAVVINRQFLQLLDFAPEAWLDDTTLEGQVVVDARTTEATLKLSEFAIISGAVSRADSPTIGELASSPLIASKLQLEDPSVALLC